MDTKVFGFLRRNFNFLERLSSPEVCFGKFEGHLVRVSELVSAVSQ